MHNMKCIPRPGQLKFILYCLPAENKGLQSRLLSADLSERCRKKGVAGMQRGQFGEGAKGDGAGGGGADRCT